jgi:transposase
MDRTKDKFILRWAKKYRAYELLGGKCRDCGESDIFKLHFHHIDPDEKEFTISQFKNKPWEAYEAEVNKCVLLCANCHMIHHSNEIIKMFNEHFSEIYDKSKIVDVITKSKLNDEYIYEMLLKGFSLNFIAKSLNKDVSTIRTIAIKLEETVGKQLFNRLSDYNDLKQKITNEELIESYNNGMNGKEIAKKFDMSPSTIYQRINRLKTKKIIV